MAPSSKLLHRVTVPDLADFKCYTDGRIEALFSDRTLLKTQSKVESGLVRVFTPKGEWCTVRLDRAIGFEK